MKRVVLAAMLLAACLPARPRAAPGARPPSVSSPLVETSLCPRSQRMFDQGLGDKGGQVAIPGDDSLPITLTVSDRSTHYELAKLAIELMLPDGQRRTVYSGPSEPTEQDGDFTLQLSLGERATVRIHALVRPAAHDGIFKEVAVCYDKHAVVTFFPGEKEGEILLSDGDPNLPPGSWSVLSFQHGLPDPSAQ